MNSDDLAAAMGVRLEDVAHIIQVALTPVFLLSGIASLLNVVNARLGRIADRADLLKDRLEPATGAEARDLRRRGRRLRRRMRSLDIARAGGALAGICICAATFTLLLGALRNSAVATGLFVLFGGSVLGTTVCFAGLFAETALSWNRHIPPPEMEEDALEPASETRS